MTIIIDEAIMKKHTDKVDTCLEQAREYSIKAKRETDSGKKEIFSAMADEFIKQSKEQWAMAMLYIKEA